MYEWLESILFLRLCDPMGKKLYEHKISLSALNFIGIILAYECNINVLLKLFKENMTEEKQNNAKWPLLSCYRMNADITQNSYLKPNVHVKFLRGEPLESG